MRFSVIVPVYRTEVYLDRCVRSVLSQSTPDLELILVDDCSPDRCGSLCDEYAALDPRVRVIHKPVNEGLGFARNTGLEAAQGDFVLFLDSDDWLRKDALERCGCFPEADILVFGTTFVYEKNGKEERRCPESVGKQEAAADLFAMLTRARIFQFAWNKRYRRTFLRESGVLFERTALIEDFLFNIALLPKAGAVRCIPDALHFYRKPAHETLASRYDPEFFQLAKRKYLLEEQLLADTPEHRQLIYESYVKHLISAVLRNASPAAGLSRQQQKQALDTMLRDPVTMQVMHPYHPKDARYRLLKSWIVHQNKNLILTGCRILGLLEK